MFPLEAFVFVVSTKAEPAVEQDFYKNSRIGNGIKSQEQTT